jgi:hypothetical protein
MLRYLAPYLALACVVIAAGGIAYGTGAIGVLGAYAAALLATVVSGAGYARWDERRYPPRR